ncbi:prevent-host-death family protein [Idiomarina sp.]|uniref:prevent-host-death family protein n=1 Tax=Idiomarina sp. TaxID=1874361 RepID=UPI002620FE10|nr:prevent-host-death family protein [Idiomarina sp.]
MKKVRVDKNTRPLPEFRAERGVSVRVDVQDYEKMQERLELLEEVYKAEEQLANGEGISHEEAKSRVLSRLAQ